ncbi:MAG: rifampicin phosphotransferase, partial [Solirubrobacteraceae bacterium]|nr:rifampicin phosphotransferase [Solirubrobacteraceae bacterium]
MPGVQTPLSWTLWSRGTEHAPREAAFQIGGLTRRERAVPPLVKDRYIRPFYGRPAIQVEFFTALGDRMPGTTGQATAVSVLGRAPDDIVYSPTLRRLPVIAWRLPLAHARAPARLREKARQHDAWYAGAAARSARLDLAGAVA